MEAQNVPRHVAIIMDGNGRWARSRGLSRAEGHRAGGEALRRTVEACRDLGIKILTVYVFSTENWKRPRTEVRALMDLIIEYVRKERDELIDNNVRVVTIGDVDGLPPATRREIRGIVQATAANDGHWLCLALNYGGRRDIVGAARRLAAKVAAGELAPEQINESLFSEHLLTAGLPDPDLLIRPSGELRVSNFLLWQMAYTELWFTSAYWPDFGAEELQRAVAAYQARSRRFGGLELEQH